MKKITIRTAIIAVALFLVCAPIWGHAAPPQARTQPGSFKDYPLGCIPDTSGIQRCPTFIGSPNRSLPASVDLTNQFPKPLLQEGSSCVGYAVAYAAKTNQEFYLHPGWDMDFTANQMSPLFVYNQLHNNDKGIPISLAMEYVRDFGACTRSSFAPGNVNQQPTNVQRDEAAGYRAAGYSKVTTVTGMKECLANGNGVIIGIYLYDDFDLSADNPIYDIPGVVEDDPGLHAVCLIGYDDNIGGSGAFRFINSWGDWGIYGSNGYLGYGWIAYEMLENSNVFNNEGYVFTDLRTVNRYNITYNDNGGTGSPPAQRKFDNETVQLSSTIPTGSNFTLTYNANGGSVSPANKSVPCSFQNWNTNAAGTGTSYNSGANYSNNNNISLYAQYAGSVGA